MTYIIREIIEKYVNINSIIQQNKNKLRQK